MHIRSTWSKGAGAPRHFIARIGLQCQHPRERAPRHPFRAIRPRFPARQTQCSASSTPPEADASSAELTEVLTLALPALAVVLSDPMQSLIDSACVGRSSTIHLAALGPNTTIFNAAFQLFSFLGVATANTIASNSLSLPGLTQADLAARRDTAETALCNSVFLATLLGIGVAGVLRWQGAAWLGAMGTDPRVLPIAVDYLLVRALASPAVLVMNACQGACLGQQDTLTPMWVCLGATAFNLVGDIYLIWGAGMGVVGAALATAVAQALASLYFLARLLHGDGRKEAGGRGDLRLRWTGLPKLHSMQSFFAVAITLVARTAVGMVAYFAMAVAATRLGLVATASHQVAMQTFWFLSFFPEPLSMAAQTLLARFQGHAEASQVRAVLLVKSGAIMGVVLAAVVAGMFLFGTGIFTQDPAVQAAVRQLAPLGALAMAVCGVMMMFDGISIGSGAFRHLPALVGAGMVAVLGVLWYGLQTGAGLTAVWWGLCAFYGVRLAGHMLYYWASWPHNVFAGARRGTPKEPGNEGGPVVPAPAL